MAETFDLIIHNGTCVTPSGRAETSVGVRDGKIVAIGDLDPSSAKTAFDAKGLHVLPGVIDSQVHFREPGAEHKEDLAHGTKAAIMGGVTAIFEMPNTNPLTITTEAIADKVTRARGRAWCDFAFFMGAAAENADDMGRLELSPGCCGVKLFMGASTGNLLIADDPTIERVLRHGVRRVAIHAEDEYRMQDRFHIAEEAANPRAHPEWRDAESARLATERLLRIAKRTGRRVHVLHITTAEEITLLAAHKDVATVECTPQHLTLEAPDCYDRLGAFAQMNPPIRDAHHRAGLWAGVQSGVVDVIGSDHAPHTREEKSGTYPNTPSGMPGVQTLVPVMLNHVHEGRLTLERFVDLTAHGPQRIYNIAGKGRLVVGYDADFTLVDLQETRTITDDWIVSKCGWTPFNGMDVTGWPMATIIRGATVMRDGAVQDGPAGVPVRFQDTMGEG
jgi:dihydroorotase